MKNTNLKTNTTTIRLLISVVALMLTASLSIWGWRRTPNRIIPCAGDEGPQTAQEHRERADQYQKKAAEYRKEAEALRRC